MVAESINRVEKIVFSRTLREAKWNNSSILKDNIVAAIQKMKQTPGKDLTILGSGSIVTQFAEAGLIDEYQFMIDPVVIAGGTQIFNGMSHKLNLELISTRSFKSGVALHCYRPKDSK